MERPVKLFQGPGFWFSGFDAARLMFPPEPPVAINHLARTARSSQGRAVFGARRSEPLTASTVPAPDTLATDGVAGT